MVVFIFIFGRFHLSSKTDLIWIIFGTYGMTLFFWRFFFNVVYWRCFLTFWRCFWLCFLTLFFDVVFLTLFFDVICWRCFFNVVYWRCLLTLFIDVVFWRCFFDVVFLTLFFYVVYWRCFLTYNHLTIASFRIGVPSILLFPKC